MKKKKDRVKERRRGGGVREAGRQGGKGADISALL